MPATLFWVKLSARPSIFSKRLSALKVSRCFVPYLLTSQPAGMSTSGSIEARGRWGSGTVDELGVGLGLGQAGRRPGRPGSPVGRGGPGRHRHGIRHRLAAGGRPAAR